MTAEPRTTSGWLRGWACVLASAALCALVSFLILNTVAYPNIPLATWADAKKIVIGVPLIIVLFSPLTTAITILPVAVFYVALRLAARRFRVTWFRRLAVGILMGAILNIWVLDFALGLAEDKQSFLEGEASNLFFPFSEIQTTTGLVALFSRKQWFGVP